jgi:hypothetical protein
MTPEMARISVEDILLTPLDIRRLGERVICNKFCSPAAENLMGLQLHAHVSELSY